MSDKLRAAAQAALEAIEELEYRSEDPTANARVKAENAKRKLRAALAEQAEAEPQATPAWWRDGLTATLMREGINKHRAREIADGYWQAYCEIGGNDD